jgi:nucleotidyltransferase/DNA polymerase involved in DNA repair
MPNPRSILHVDLDAFYVAVERLRDPSLVGKPVVVGADPRGGRGRGVVAAASYEARVFGVHSAMPIGEAYRRCPDGVYVGGHRDLYARAARAVRRVFAQFTPAIEPVSIDEAYLDLTGTERLHGPPARTAERIRSAVLEQTRLPVSMGLGTTKTIAKIASDLAKPEGFLQVLPGREAVFLAPLPLRCLPGVGPATRERLVKYNLKTVGDLARLDQDILTGVLGEQGSHFLARATGGGGGRVASRDHPKSVSRECTFDTDTTDLEFCEAMLFYLSERVCHDLRTQRLSTRTVTLKLRHHDFTTVARSITLPSPTDSDRTVAKTARELFHAACGPRPKIRLLGVGLSNLVAEAPQLELFASPRALAWDRLMAPLDRLRKRYGPDAVRSGPTLALRDRDQVDD